MDRTVKKRSINVPHIEIILTDFLILITEYWILKYYPNPTFSVIIALTAILVNTLRFWFSKQLEEILDWIIKYRYCIALVVFMVLVGLQVNGSSIGVYDQTYGKADPTIVSEVFGRGRLIRSDEWNVQVPYFFSQSYNGFQLNSDYMGLSPQNMIIGYNAPVWDLTLIGKPFIWGYLLFGNSVGLSWYWCSKILLFLLVGYELFFILTKKRYLSLFSSIALVFSPVLQWWLAPHMYQVFFWSSSLYVVGYYFFLSHNTKERVLFTALAIACLTGFVVAIFPSLQVALGLLMFFLLIGTLARDYREIEWNKPLAIQILIVLLCTGIVLGNFLLESIDAISLLNNTVYPGKRVSLGGNYSFSVLFTNPSVALTPFHDPAISNACELSTFNQLGLLFLLSFPYLIYLNKQSGKNYSLIPGYILCGAMVIEIVFMLFGFPEVLAKLTLFSYINRMDMVYGFTAFLFTFWSIGVFCNLREKINWKIGAIISIIYIAMYCHVVDSFIDPNFEVLVGRRFFYLAAILFGFIGYLIFTKWYSLFFSVFASWTVISGMLVNPIVLGAESISNHDLVIASQEISQTNPEARWAALNSTTTQELLLANGIKVINGVNFYPDQTKWELLDPSGEYDPIYNRYAHIYVSLTDQSTYLDLIAADCIHLYLSINDLSKLGIEYLVGGPEDYELLISNGLNAELVYSDYTINQQIYKLEN